MPVPRGRHSGSPSRKGGRRRNPLTANGRRVSDPRNKDRSLGGEVVAGRHAVRELLRAGSRSVRDVWMLDGLDPSDVLAEIEKLARDRNVPVRSVGHARLEAEAKTDAPQGVIAHAAPLREVAVEELLESTAVPFLIVLDGVTDPHNVGSILRSALCAGATGAVLPRHRSAHVTATVAKAAAGAIEHLPIAVEPGIPAALERLSDRGIWTVGLAGEADSSIFGLKLADQPLALVLGAEGEGLSKLSRKRCDVLASIPLSGPLDSLNVSNAAAVAMYEINRRRNDAQG